MSVLADWQIAELAVSHQMITPFDAGGKRPGVISSGVSSYGYDMRLGRHFKVFTDIWGAVIDPKAFDPKAFVEIEGDTCLIPPNSHALAESLETFIIPENVLGIVLGKSTYARCGILINCTPMEPGWRGALTIEIANLTPLPAKVYAGEGIAQVVFLTGAEACARGYGQRSGLYQDQAALTLPRVQGGANG